MVAVSEVLRGWGMKIFAGFRRFVSVMCFFVVRVSQMGVEVLSSSSSLSAMRLFFPLDLETSFWVELMCLRRAFEAFNTCRGVSKMRNSCD